MLGLTLSLQSLVLIVAVVAVVVVVIVVVDVAVVARSMCVVIGVVVGGVCGRHEGTKLFRN